MSTNVGKGDFLMEDIRVKQVFWGKDNFQIKFSDAVAGNLVVIARKELEEISVEKTETDQSNIVDFNKLPYDTKEITYDLFVNDGEELKRVWVGKNINFSNTYYWVNKIEDIIAVPYITKSRHLALYVGNRFELFEKRLKIDTQDMMITQAKFTADEHIIVDLPENTTNTKQSLYVNIKGQYINLKETSKNSFAVSLEQYTDAGKIWLRLIKENVTGIYIYKIYVLNSPISEPNTSAYYLDTTGKGEIVLINSQQNEDTLVTAFNETEETLIVELVEDKKLTNIGILSNESNEFIKLPFTQIGKQIRIEKADLLQDIDVHQSKWEFAINEWSQETNTNYFVKLKFDNTFFVNQLDKYLTAMDVTDQHIERYSPIIRNYVVMPYITKRNYLALSLRDKYFIYREKYNQSAKIKDIQMSGSKLSVSFELKAKYPFTVDQVELKLRSSLENDSKFVDVIQDKGMFKVVIDLSTIELKEFYYEAFAIMKFEDGGIGYARLAKAPKALKNKINKSIFKYNVEHKDTNSVDYPFITNRNVLYIAHRVRGEEESFGDKVNEWLAMAANKLFKKQLSKKDIWLVFEKNSTTAQDNGYYFFKWMYENHPEKEVYYVITKDSKDYDRLAPMKDRVLTYMSFKHLLYLAAATLLIAPETRGHAFTWRQQKGRLRNVLDKKKLVFLQHGVTAFKHNDAVLDHSSPSAVSKYIVTSTQEQQIIHEGLHYPVKDIFVTGFARWDALEDKSTTQEQKRVFVMPTWRGWLDSISVEDFVQTPYYENYMNVLNSNRLNDLLVENNVVLDFFLHPKFKEYTSDFKTEFSNINILDFNDVQVNEKLMESSLLITDYSSVAWDMHYMNKPVLFYQFDYQDYMNLTGSYIDIKENLFGHSSASIEQLIDQIEMYISNSFTNEPEFSDLAKSNFAYVDDANSQRIYEQISDKGNW